MSCGVLNIPLTSYLLRDAPSEAMRRAVLCDAMRRPERREAMRRAKRRARPGGKIFNFALWATSLTLGCVRASTTPLSLNREVQLSTFNFQLRGRRPLVPLTLQSYNTGRAKASIWAKRCRAAPRFPSAPPVQRLHCQPLSGKWAERTTG